MLPAVLIYGHQAWPAQPTASTYAAKNTPTKIFTSKASSVSKVRVLPAASGKIAYKVSGAAAPVADDFTSGQAVSVQGADLEVAASRDVWWLGDAAGSVTIYAAQGGTLSQASEDIAGDFSGLGIASLWVPGVGCFTDHDGSTNTAAITDTAQIGRIQDLVGGRDAIQATGGNKPTLATGANGINGKPGMKFANTQKLVTTATDIPTVINSGGGHIDAYFVIRRTTTGNTLKVLAGTGNGGAQFYFGYHSDVDQITVKTPPAGGASFQCKLKDSGLYGYLAEDTKVFGIHYNPVAQTVEFSVNGATIQRAETTAVSGTPTYSAVAYTIGDFIGTFAIGDVLGAHAICTGGHTADQRKRMAGLLCEYYGIDSPVIVFEGDSLTGGYKLSGGADQKSVGGSLSDIVYQILLAEDVDQLPGMSGLQCVNRGIPGRTVDNCLNATPNSTVGVDHYAAPSRRAKIAVLWIGTNDVAVDAVSVTFVLDSIKARIAVLKASGFDHVILVTMIARADTTVVNGIGLVAEAAQRAELNTGILSTYAAMGASAVVDLTDIAILNTQPLAGGNAAYNADLVHLKFGGVRLVAGRVAKVLVPILRKVAAAIATP